MNDKLDLSVNIVNWNAGPILIDCIDAIFNTIKNVSFQIIVVDNASSDESIEQLRTKYPGINLILNKENIGFASGHNKAFSQMSCRYALILNPDCIVGKSVIDSMIDYMDNHPDAGIAAPKAIGQNGILINPVIPIPDLCTETFQTLKNTYPFHYLLNLKESIWNTINHNSEAPVKVNAVGGPFLLVNTTMIEEVGILENSFFLFSEEVDWCKRAGIKGWEILYFPMLKVWHDVGTCRRKLPSSFSEYHFYRSRLLFFKKHYGFLNTILLSLVYLFFCVWTLFVESCKNLIFYAINEKRTEIYILLSKARMKAVADVIKNILYIRDTSR